MPFFNRLRRRARDLANRVRHRVVRSAASSVVNVGNRLQAAGQQALDQVGPSPGMGQRHGPIRDNASDSSIDDDSVPSAGNSGTSSNSLQRSNPRGNLVAGGICTEPNQAWGGRPRVHRAAAVTPPSESPIAGPSSSRGRGRSLRPGQDDRRHGRVLDETYTVAGHQLPSYQESQADYGQGASGYNHSMLSQYETAQSSASWYNTSGQESWYNGTWAPAPSYYQSGNAGQCDGEDSDEVEAEYENVGRGEPCNTCGASVSYNKLSRRRGRARHGDYFLRK